MDGYIRVSRRMGREGPGYISPDVQREAIQRWADYKDVEIVAWHVDEDWSGGTHKRPGLEAAVERAVTGETGGIVSWKIDRFSRYTEGGLRDLRRLEEMNARLAFVTEDIDTSGPMGKFVYTVMLAMSEYFLDNIKAGWVTAKTRAMNRGVKLGPTPVGYRRADDGKLEPDPIEGPIVAGAFEAAAERGLQAAVDHLTDAKLVHADGKRAGRERSWTTSTVRRLLNNRSYLGEAIYGERHDRDAHPPLVARAIWEAAQPKEPRRRKPRREYPLSGLAQCGTCGEAMIGGNAGAGLRTYRCRASLKLWKGDQCPAPATTVAQGLEDYVRAALADFLRQRWTAHEDLEGELAQAEMELRDAEAELDSLVADASLRRTLGPDRFRQLVEGNVQTVDEAQARYRNAAGRAAHAFTIAEPELVESASHEELGVLARGGLEAVVVKRGRGRLEDRVRIIPKGVEAEAGISAAENAKDGGVEATARRRRQGRSRSKRR
jgi:site-specific DNA recombinase